MAASAAEILSRLETSDYTGIRQSFLQFLHPFEDFISFDLDYSKKQPKKKADLKLIHPLAKQFSSFIFRALKIFPNRLTELLKQGGGAGVKEDELLDSYKICLECLEFVLPCLEQAKPFSYHVHRVNLVRLLEAWGKYQEAEVEAFFILESVGSGKRVQEGFVGDLVTADADPELASLVLDLVVSITKCTYKSKKEEQLDFKRVLVFVDQVRPWLRAKGSKAIEKWHGVLVMTLYKCTLFILKKEAIFGGDLIHKFFMKTLSECLESQMKVDFFKLALNICLSIDSLWKSRPLLILDILKCALDYVVVDKKVGNELTECFYLVNYCAKRYRLASAVKDVARSLEKLANNFVEVVVPISSILRLYAAGLFADTKFPLQYNKSESLVALEITFIFDCGKDLQNLVETLGTLASYYHTSSSQCALAITPSNFQCSTTCKSEPGNTSFLSYLSALAFFCQPFGDFVTKNYKPILAEKDPATLSLNTNYIQAALHQFSDAFLIGFRYSYTAERESEMFDKCQKTLLNVSVAAFVLSFGIDKKVQENADRIAFIISTERIQSKDIEVLVSSLYNVGAELYNTKRMKLASAAFEICCRVAWTCALILCSKFKEKSGKVHEDGSEEAITGLVTGACEKSTLLLDVLDKCGSPDVHTSVTTTLLNWSVASNLFENLSGPMAFVRKWVKIKCKDRMDVDVVDDVPVLYCMLSKSSAAMKRTLGIILEQELLAYEEMEAQYTNFCRKMQLKIIDSVLSSVYVTQNYRLEKSRTLIKKARVFRAFGSESLNNCIQCLSEAISILVDMSGESSGSNSHIFHYLAIAYGLRAMCTQESQPNSEVVLSDIRHALKLWLNIDWSLDVPYELGTENVPLLFCMADLLSLKGYFDLQHDIYKLITILFKRNNMPLEKCLAILWADRRLSHAFCTTPVHGDFILSLAHQYSVDSDSVNFWMDHISDSQALVTGFRQKFLLLDAILPQVGRCPPEIPLGSHISIDEVKRVAIELVSNVHEPGTEFLAACLYHGLSERLISRGQLIEALSFAREAFRLCTKLLRKKFKYTLSLRSKNSGEIGENTREHECDHTYLEVLESVATEVWPRNIGSLNLESRNLSQWNVLQCYLESMLQVAVILESIGNASLAEAYLVRGKDISCFEGLPFFTVVFASALGQIYSKKQFWDLAERELDCAKQILVDSSKAMSCKRCKLILEVTVDEQIGDLTRRRFIATTRSSSVTSLSGALALYTTALEKLNLPESGITLSFLKETKEINQWDNKELCSQKVENVKSLVKMESKKVRKSKNTTRHLMKEQNVRTGPNIRMTRSRTRSSQQTSVIIQREVESECSENLSENCGFSCSDTRGRTVSLLELNWGSTSEFENEEACICNKMNCWRCLLMKVVNIGTMQDFINIKWEIFRRKLSLRLLNKIGKCMRGHTEFHEIHDIFWKSISVLVNGKQLYDTFSSFPHSILLDLIGKERQGDVFSVERAEMLYSFSWFSLKNISSNYARSSCCGFSHIKISSVVTWLQQAFVLSRELPLLFHKVSRLLATVFSLSTLGDPFSLDLYSGTALSVIHWAAFFHQASLGSGTYLNHQFLPNPNAQIKVCNSMDFEGSHFSGSPDRVLEACNLLRLAPEKVDDLESFVVDFFQSLPTFTVICISLVGPNYVDLLKNVLPCLSASPACVLFSRLNSTGEPIVMFLPSYLIVEPLDDGDSVTASADKGNTPREKWHCPWGSTIVDDVAPQFKQILEDNYISSSSSFVDDKHETRLLWWALRRKLNDRLDKFLSCIEDSWLGPWKCLLLGEPLDCVDLDSVVSELVRDLKLQYDWDGNDNLLRHILGGAKSASQIETCISQLLLHKGCIMRWGCSREKKGGLSSACDEAKILSSMPRQLITEAASKLEMNCFTREPIVLVLDSDVQMLPWENLPILRTQEVYRMPSVGSIFALLNMNYKLQGKVGKISATFPSIDPLDAFYLLNPSGDLSHTQLEFEDWFRDQKLEGKVGSPPKVEELVSALKNHDLFMYFGHGSGAQYIPGYKIQKLENCAATLLMGCSSGSLSLRGSYNAEGAVLSYLLAGSPAIIANLWEVTDKDIDRFGKAMVNAWLRERSTSSNRCDSCNSLVKDFESLDIDKEKNNGEQLRERKISEDCCCHRPRIGSFMSQAREACTLQFLIGAAPVCYGVPTCITKKE